MKYQLIETVRLLRPSQYVKNLLVFAPAFFAGTILNDGVPQLTIFIFISFCFAASAMYVFNDYCDVNFDKMHPVKRNRPLAAGTINKNTALGLAGSSSALSLLFAYFVSFTAVILISAYILLNILYSLGLKNIPIAELVIVSFGFILRLYSGSIPIETPLTLWIQLLTFSLAMLLVSAKRYHDLKLFETCNQLMRPVLAKYNSKMLSIIVLASALLVFGIYLFWSLFSHSFPRKEPDWLFVSALFVGIGLIRYLWIVFKDENSGFPVEVFYSDNIIKLNVLGWMVLMMVYFYA
jgi:4-hydroxybenzoate polyprenyltransferase